MISRVAEQCFWLGRYIERAESTARLLFVTTNLAMDSELSALEVWTPVLIVNGEEDAFAERFGADGADDGERVEEYMTWDAQNMVSIRQSVTFARENARSIREVISLECWQALNEMYVWLQSDGARTDWETSRHDFYGRVRRHLLLCQGLFHSTMLHDEPLDFILLGQYLERAHQGARDLDVTYHTFAEASRKHPVLETALWLSLLRGCSGFEPFMKREGGQVTAGAVVDFLFHEVRFPRSVRYGVTHALDRLGRVRSGSDDPPGARAYARLRSLDEDVVQTDIAALDPAARHAAITRVVEETSRAAAEITEDIFGRPGMGSNA